MAKIQLDELQSVFFKNRILQVTEIQQETAKAFLKLAKGQKILFPQAKNSLKSIQHLIENESSTQESNCIQKRKKAKY